MKVLVSQHINCLISTSMFRDIHIIQCSETLKGLLSNIGRDLDECFFHDEPIPNILQFPGVYLVDIDILYETPNENTVSSELDYKIRIKRIWKYNIYIGR